MKQKLSITLWVVLTLITFFPRELKACTGITLRAKDGSRIVARTIEWGGSNLNSQYVVVPRGYKQQSYIPGGTTEGMIFTARYGYIGLAVEQEQFVAEGLNEAGLSAGLFYFPQYGKYETYNSKEKASSIADLQLVSWILGSCRTVDEVKESIKHIQEETVSYLQELFEEGRALCKFSVFEDMNHVLQGHEVLEFGMFVDYKKPVSSNILSMSLGDVSLERTMQEVLSQAKNRRVLLCLDEKEIVQIKQMFIIR